MHDVALLDLDGVVYIGSDAVPGAPTDLAMARDHGMRLAFVTNNAARPPATVAAHLTELGIEAKPEQVITSAQAAARYLADRLTAGARVLVVGTSGLIEALNERGLTPVSDADGHVDAVVQGYSPDVDWRLLAEGAVAINRGVLWVATNVDPTVPSPRGPLPGNGSLVAALRLATKVDPIVTGKPDPTMHRETLLRTGAERPIVVGDRLDTDIEGANAVGCPSLLVLSGVTTPAELLAARPDLRPTYLGADVGALVIAHPEPEISNDGASCRGWRVTTGDRRIRLARAAGADAAPPAARTPERPDDTPDEDVLDALRALCAAQWSGSDAAGGLAEVSPAPADDGAAQALSRLGFG